MGEHERENQRFIAECEYLAELLRTGGNPSVPYEKIGSYFAVQVVAAQRARFYCLADTLQHIAGEWRAFNPDAARREAQRETLLAHAAALRGFALGRLVE